LTMATINQPNIQNKSTCHPRFFSLSFSFFQSLSHNLSISFNAQLDTAHRRLSSK
jgi:hypothetical protein